MYNQYCLNSFICIAIIIMCFCNFLKYGYITLCWLTDCCLMSHSNRLAIFMTKANTKNKTRKRGYRGGTMVGHLIIAKKKSRWRIWFEHLSCHGPSTTVSHQELLYVSFTYKECDILQLNTRYPLCPRLTTSSVFQSFSTTRRN